MRCACHCATGRLQLPCMHGSAWHMLAWWQTLPQHAACRRLWCASQPPSLPIGMKMPAPSIPSLRRTPHPLQSGDQLHPQGGRSRAAWHYLCAPFRAEFILPDMSCRTHVWCMYVHVINMLGWLSLACSPHSCCLSCSYPCACNHRHVRPVPLLWSQTNTAMCR